jgi:GH18 family chitinase
VSVGLITNTHSYFEGWSLTRRGCAGRTIDDIPVDSLSHLNLAFAYIKPKTFEARVPFLLGYKKRVDAQR